VSAVAGPDVIEDVAQPVVAVGSVEALLRLDPLARFEALIRGANFADYLRAEPIVFELRDPIYGYACQIPACQVPASHPLGWCSQHFDERAAALRGGIGEAAWKAAAVGFPARGARKSPMGRLPACRFCPDRDAVHGELCRAHRGKLGQATKRSVVAFDYEAWAARQIALPGVGDCLVRDCARRAEQEPALCPSHRPAWVQAGSPRGVDLDRWVARASGDVGLGVVSLAGLAPLLAAELRYALWAHTRDVSPARWHPMLLRTLVKSCRARRIASLLALDPGDQQWTQQAGAVNRIVRQMRRDVDPVHRSREDTRRLGYLDTNYWGFRFPHRRSVFDLSTITQPWLQDLTWQYLADVLDGPNRPRTQGSFETIRRSIVSFSHYLHECDPDRGEVPGALSPATARGFVADFTRRVSDRKPVRGMVNADGSSSPATQVSYALALNALRRVMRTAMDSGAAQAIGLPREFIVALPYGGSTVTRNPRPFSDPVLRALSDPANIALLDKRDPQDGGLADIWSIQVRCGRRISEVVRLRLDCVSEHLGRTWLWVDMTKVGKLDYAIQIPRDVYDVVLARQVKTAGKYRLKHGVEPIAAQRRRLALFPSRVSNPTLERSLSTQSFTVAFKAWIESETMSIPGHTTHQARHTLATRLIEAGASMTHVKRVLGQVSERMGESYVLIAGTQVEPYLQQVWVTGPGNADPGQLVLTPTDAEKHTAQQQMIDLAAIPTEHGLCTFKPVVGGFDCPYNRDCAGCGHFVITGADYGYWKRQEQRWAALAEAAPDKTARDYLYQAFDKSSQALAGLEKALLALGLLDQAKQLDLRSPHQDFFDPVWRQGWRAGDLIHLGSHPQPDGEAQPSDASLDGAS
jgi:integrase